MMEKYKPCGAQKIRTIFIMKGITLMGIVYNRHGQSLKWGLIELGCNWDGKKRPRDNMDIGQLGY